MPSNISSVEAGVFNHDLVHAIGFVHHVREDSHRSHGDSRHGHSDQPQGQSVDGGAIVVDPHSVVSGKTISEWAERWTTWGLQAPNDRNPLTDETGAFASTNNHGPIFFIGGTFNTGPDSPTAVRSFEVPAGKPLLVPLITAFDTEGPGIPPTVPELDPHYKLEVNTVLQDWDTNSSLFAEIDGKPVHDLRDYRLETDFFSMGKVKNGSLLASLGVDPGTPLDTTKAVGYWLMITGLSKGEHTLEFGGSFTSQYVSGTTHVIDHIDVV